MVGLSYNIIVLLSYYFAPDSRFKGRAICNCVFDRHLRFSLPAQAKSCVLTSLFKSYSFGYMSGSADKNIESSIQKPFW